MSALERTVKLMQSWQKGGMLKLIVDESGGSNAGTDNGDACLAANFYFDIQTGEIVHFGNEPFVPATILHEYQHGHFRIRDSRTEPDQIIEYHAPFASVNAKTTIENAIVRYNESRRAEKTA